MIKPSTIFVAASLLCGLTAVTLAEDLAAGRAIFTETSVPACALCHTLADAEAEAKVGPNLDDFKPTFEQVRAAVTSGIGVMPAYEETLSEEEIVTVAKYVAEVTGGAEAEPATKEKPETEDKDEKS